MPPRATVPLYKLLPSIRRETGAETGYFDAGRMLVAETPVNLVAFAPFAYPARLNENKAALLANYLSTLAAAREGALVTPAAEWLLDNHHIVEESFRHLRRDLVLRYY